MSNYELELRDKIATEVMSRLVSSVAPHNLSNPSKIDYADIAEVSYGIADAMMQARNEESR